MCIDLLYPPFGEIVFVLPYFYRKTYTNLLIFVLFVCSFFLLFNLFSFIRFSMINQVPNLLVGLVGTSGLEPPTSRLSGARSNHLSYAPLWLLLRGSLTHTFGGDDGNRTHDPLLAGQVLSQLSYTPIGLGLFLQFLYQSLKIEQQVDICFHSTALLTSSSLPLFGLFLPICKYEISVSDISHSP